MSRPPRLRTDLYRAGMSWVLSVAVTGLVGLALTVTDSVDFTDSGRALVLAYGIMWPAYVAIYVAWSIRFYRRLTAPQLHRIAVAEIKERARWLQKMLGNNSSDTSISAASVAVIVTVVIAVQPAFRGNVVYLFVALLTVAASWALMVFSFAQAYLHLQFGRNGESHLEFTVPGEPEFDDFLTLATLISTMSATSPAVATTRPGWKLIRVNVILAFVFNSVIIAMIVSLLFSGLLG